MPNFEQQFQKSYNPSLAPRLKEYRHKLRLNRKEFSEFSKLPIDIINKLEHHEANMSDETFAHIQQLVESNLHQNQVIKSHFDKQSFISSRLLLQLERKANQLLHFKNSAPNKIMETVKTMLMCKEVIYYHQLDNIAQPQTWPEAKTWKQLLNKHHIDRHSVQYFKLTCGKHNSLKYADVFTIKQNEPYDATILQRPLNNFIQSHRLKSIQKLQAEIHNDPDKNQLVVIIYH